jgi:hypothetical protein
MEHDMSTTTYLDVLANIAASGADGIRYATLARSAKRHVTSLAADGFVFSYLPSGEFTTFDHPEAMACLTEDGGVYVELMQEGGLIAADVYSQPVSRLPKANKSKRGKVAAATRKVRQEAAAPVVEAEPVSARKPKAPKTVPTATESVVVSPVLPSGEAAGRRVPGNAKGDQIVATPAEPSLADVMALLTQQAATISALKAVVLA